LKKIYEYIIGSFFCNGLNGEYTTCTDTDCNSIEFLLLDENLKIRQSKSSHIGKLPKRTTGTWRSNADTVFLKFRNESESNFIVRRFEGMSFLIPLEYDSNWNYFRDSMDQIFSHNEELNFIKSLEPSPSNRTLKIILEVKQRLFADQLGKQASAYNIFIKTM
jgi:hypothetical protein